MKKLLTKFVVISQQRSGTNLLRSLLNSHQDIFCYGEMFINGAKGGDLTKSGKEYKIEYFFNQGLDVGQYLDKLYNSMPDKKAIGFDIKYNQLFSSCGSYVNEVIDYIKNNEVKVIHLIRKDMFSTILSDRCYRDLNFPITVDKEHFIKELKTLNCHIQFYSQAFNAQNHIPIKYEEICSQESIHELSRNLNKKLTKFLGVKDKKMVTDMEKVHKKGYREKITNYDKLYQLAEKEGLLKCEI